MLAKPSRNLFELYPGFYTRILSQHDHLESFIIMQRQEVFQVWLGGLGHDHLILVSSSTGFYNRIMSQ
jgi:hypothetical protein